MEREGAGRVEFVHRSWPADPRQLAGIRRELAGWLAPLSLTEDEVADVVLAVDEAAANAVRHAYGADESGVVELTLWTEPGTLCIEIVDHGSWRAEHRQDGDPPAVDVAAAPGVAASVDAPAGATEAAESSATGSATATSGRPVRAGHGIPMMQHTAQAVLIRFGGGRGSRVLLRHHIPDRR